MDINVLKCSEEANLFKYKYIKYVACVNINNLKHKNIAKGIYTAKCE